MKKIMIGSNTDVLAALLENRFKGSAELFYFNNGTDILEAFTKIDPDLLVIDLLLPEVDGLSVIRRLKGKGHARRLVVTTKLSDFAYNAAINNGADLFVIMPLDLDDLCDHITQLLNYKESAIPSYDNEVFITGLLQKLGFNAASAGTRYLRAGIPIYAKDQSQQFCKEVIPAIVEACQCRSTDQVEHAIREAIRYAWNNGDPESWLTYFSSSRLFCSKCPTNKAFIARMALELLQEETRATIPGTCVRA